MQNWTVEEGEQEEGGGGEEDRRYSKKMTSSSEAWKTKGKGSLEQNLHNNYQ